MNNNENMILLMVFAFMAGLVTILSPCILPVLPVILASSVDTKGKRRPLGVIIGFILSFTFFTLFLSTIVRLIGIPAESLRYLSVFILTIFGLSLIVTKIKYLMEQLFNKLTNFTPKGQRKQGFTGGLIIGFSLGLLWTPCVGPILASVISLALTSTVNSQAVVITTAYSIGTAIPMFIIMQTGSTVLRKVPWLMNNSGKIQKVFGIVMITTAIGIFLNVDRQFQTFILNTFPKYGIGLTKFEDNATVKNELDKINQTPVDEKQIGLPMSDLTRSKGPLAPEIIPGAEWFNSEPLKLSSLKGKVVIIDFWTYTCINCQRTLPYLRQWWNKYKDKGLMIIGVHSPEFEFEKNEDNVRKAISDFNISYPVVQDNDFATWRAYNNRYWPAKYFIDKDGLIRYTHFGEGNYDESEKVIQELLKETGVENMPNNINNPQYQVYAKTPETYLGYGRIENFVSKEAILRDQISTYSIPKILSDNEFAYDGSWNVMEEYANPQKGAKLLINFEAKEVFLVMKTLIPAATVKVFVDDKMQYFTQDNQNGIVNVEADRLYKLISLPKSGKHILRLEFDNSNIQLFAFTFG